MAMNVIALEGRLTADPELRYTPQSVPVASFRLAVDRNFTNGQGERETDFIPVVVWRKTAETVANHLTKGRLVGVVGRLQMRQYEAQDGTKRTVYEVVADQVNFLDGKREGGPAGGSSSSDEADLPDDLPF